MDNLDLPNDFFDGDPVAEQPADIETAVLRPTGGQPVYLPIARDDAGNIIPQTLVEAAVSNGLTLPPATQFWLDGRLVGGDTILAPGMSITAVGNIKGG